MYDVENRKVYEGVYDVYAYDHAGKRLMHEYYPSTREYAVYGIGGQKLLTSTCVPHTYHQGEPGEYTVMECTNAYNVYFGGKLVKSKGVVVATDRLGSVRANGNGETFAYYPYGEERGSTAERREKFGTYTRDSTGQDYADQRYYAVGMGRFNVPDPAGSGAADLTNPTSWNTYAYVNGDPVNFNDSEGLEGWPLDCIINGMAYPPMVCQALGRPSGIRGPLLIDPLPLTRQQSWLLASGLKEKVKASGAPTMIAMLLQIFPA